MAFNKFIGVGNIVRNPEVRTVGQSQVASFSVAINERFKKQDGSVGESTLFLDCEYWNVGGVLTYLTQGTQVLVEGSLRMDSWTDQNGQKREKFKLRVISLSLVGGRPQQSQATQQQYAPQAPQPQSYYPSQQPQAPQYSQPAPPPMSRPRPTPPPPMPKDDPDMPF